VSVENFPREKVVENLRLQVKWGLGGGISVPSLLGDLESVVKSPTPQPHKTLLVKFWRNDDSPPLK